MTERVTIAAVVVELFFFILLSDQSSRFIESHLLCRDNRPKLCSFAECQF